MTALKQYERLEAAGLWRPDSESQRRDVIVSIGDATLTICDVNDRPLAHWSLAAVERLNPGTRPAIYHPDGDEDETLELPADEDSMIDAIETLRRAIERSRPHPGRLRLASVLTVVGLVALLLFFWVPHAMLNHAVKVVPDIQRKAIGQALLGRIERVAGQVCATPEATPVLNRLADRVGVRQLEVLRSGIATSLHLPGGIVLLNKSLIEDYEDPAVAAGAILIEKARAEVRDPLEELLSTGGPMATLRLLTTGQLSREVMDHYSEQLLSQSRPRLADDIVLSQFAQAAIPSSPYAYAQDITGEAVLGLIEADPMAGRKLEPVLPDRDWVLLQTICGG
ncbi:MAG: hypothetical protein ACU0BB_12400 [Paracoccaceae bacterium]